ncbi:YciI family protein [Alloscardovia venturai]|uniref:YciI family protein n=1 Tax=Alloscardovia venturai TaxID=1769421 RepID=A0ABW2Y6I8_9BIFI
MYAITISIHDEVKKAEDFEKLVDKHRAWFADQFKAGNFLMVGPLTDQLGSGMIVAQTENRDALNTILEGDAFWPNSADYTVHEWAVKMLADNIADYKA